MNGPKRWSMSLADVMAQEEMRPFHLVPGLIDANATMLAGQSEGGKSTLLCDLASSALKGGEFLGRPFTREVRRVVIIAADLGGPAEYTRRLVARGVDPKATGEDRCVLVSFRGPQPEQWNELRGELRPRLGDLVIVDPISFLLPDGGPSINTDEGVRAVWVPLGRWAEDGAAVVAAHHKSNKFQHGPTSAMGSSLFTGVARINLELRRRPGKSDTVQLETSPNSGAPETLTLDYHPDGIRVLATEDAGAAARQRRASGNALWLGIAERVVSEMPRATAADIGRAVAQWHPELTRARNPAREMSKRLSEGRDFGGYLEQGPDRCWQLRAQGGAA